MESLRNSYTKFFYKSREEFLKKSAEKFPKKLLGKCSEFSREIPEQIRGSNFDCTRKTNPSKNTRKTSGNISGRISKKKIKLYKSPLKNPRKSREIAKKNF